MPKKLTDLVCEEGPGWPCTEPNTETATRAGSCSHHAEREEDVGRDRIGASADARKRRYTIGAYPAFSLDEARNQAQEVLAAVARREDPAGQVQTRNASLTFAATRDAWVNRHGRPNKVPRALYDDQLMLKREIYPAIGAMKADEVSKRDVIGILDSVADRGARVRSNRVFALVRSIYRWGTRRGPHQVRSDPGRAPADT